MTSVKNCYSHKNSRYGLGCLKVSTIGGLCEIEKNK
jgi:hypothetical protein